MLLYQNDMTDADRRQIDIELNSLKYAEYKLLIFSVINYSSFINACHLSVCFFFVFYPNRDFFFLLCNFSLKGE